MNEQEITNKETVKYLEQIFSKELLIHNPTRFNLNGFGEIKATSMVLNHFTSDRVVPYFSFEMDEDAGEFFKEDGKYFVQYSKRREVAI